MIVVRYYALNRHLSPCAASPFSSEIVCKGSSLVNILTE
jgi:hypothetical protein